MPFDPEAIAKEIAEGTRVRKQCSFCRGWGIVAMAWPEDKVEPWRWVVCRPCWGRGMDSTLEYWTKPPTKRWHSATDPSELLHISLQVRLGSPAAPQDRLVLEEQQIRYQKKRMTRLRKRRWKVLKARLAQQWLAERQNV